MPILKVKDKETGQWEQVGVSTEATGAQIAAHNASPEAHADIRKALTDHNVATNSHADIRQAISELNAASVNLAAAQAGATQFVISTQDLQDGVTPLANNTLYLVYE